MYIYNLETNNAKYTTTHGRPFPTGCLFIDGRPSSQPIDQFWSILIIGYQCDKTRPSNFSFKGHVCLCLPSCLLGVFLSWLTSLFGIIQCDLLARLIWDSVSVFMISSLHEQRCCCDRMADGRFVRTTFGIREHVCHSFGFSSVSLRWVCGVCFFPRS